MTRSQVYCAICGAPILSDNSDSDSRRWLSDAVLLTSVHENADGRVVDEYLLPAPLTKYAPSLGPHDNAGRPCILALDARALEASWFAIINTGERIQAFCIDVPRKPGQAHSAPLYIPMHRACLQVAERFVAAKTTSLVTAQGSDPRGIVSLEALWQVLYRRLHGSGARTAVSTLPEPHDYYGGSKARNVCWEPSDDPEHAEILEQNPFDILDPTSSVINLLTPINAPAASENTTTKNSLDQEWVIQGFLNGQLIPWLWDLDTATLRDKAQSNHLDWTRVAFVLAHKGLHEPGASPAALSPALRNRRRIWRLLEEARVGDVEQSWEATSAHHAQGVEKGKQMAQTSAGMTTAQQLSSAIKPGPPGQ